MQEEYMEYTDKLSFFSRLYILKNLYFLEFF